MINSPFVRRLDGISRSSYIDAMVLTPIARTNHIAGFGGANIVHFDQYYKQYYPSDGAGSNDDNLPNRASILYVI